MKDKNINLLFPTNKEVSSGQHMVAPTAFSMANNSIDKIKRKRKKKNIKKAMGLLSLPMSVVDHRFDLNNLSTNDDGNNRCNYLHNTSISHDHILKPVFYRQYL